MNSDHIRKLVIEAIQDVAPEIEESDINPDEDMREECDIDSIDFFEFSIGPKKMQRCKRT